MYDQNAYSAARMKEGVEQSAHLHSRNGLSSWPPRELAGLLGGSKTGSDTSSSVKPDMARFKPRLAVAP